MEPILLFPRVGCSTCFENARRLKTLRLEEDHRRVIVRISLWLGFLIVAVGFFALGQTVAV